MICSQEPAATLLSNAQIVKYKYKYKYTDR